VECSNISTSDDSKLPYGAITLDTLVFISGHQDRLPVPLVTQTTLCIVLSTQFSGKLGELHLRISGEVGTIHVVVQLVKTKCLPVLCYGIEVCPANKSDIRSLQYVVDNCVRKIFDIKLKETVEECMREFNVSTAVL